MNIRAVLDLLEAASPPAPSDRFCHEVERSIDATRVELSLSPTEEYAAVIDSIYVEERGKGYGIAAMETICALADAHGITLTLEVEEDDDGAEENDAAVGSEGLMTWYLSFGFEVTGSTGWRMLMRRQPTGRG